MDSNIKRANYENIYVDCPYCNEENILNRVSDLGTTRPIDRLDNIECQYCKKHFDILGDTVTRAEYYWFLNDLYVLETKKEYMKYILNLCQGIESFFNAAILNKMIYANPNLRNERGSCSAGTINKEVEKFNNTSISGLLGSGNNNKKFEKASFNDLRKIFLLIFQEESKKE